MRVFILDGTPDEVAALAAKLPELKVLLVGSGNLVEPREPTLMPSVSRKAAAITAFRTAITRRARRLLKDPTADPIKSWDSGGERVYQLIEPVYGLWKAMKDTR